MEARRFRPGDKVRHKSGGQALVVQGYSTETIMVICEWHNDGEFMRDQFLEEVLEPYPAPVSEAAPIDDPLAGF